MSVFNNDLTHVRSFISMTSFNKALKAETWKMSVIYRAASTILAHNRNKDSAVNISSMLIIVT